MTQAVLFDLDGTLIDTAGDMGSALNNLLIEEGLPPLPLEFIRPYVSQGALVLTRLGFDSHVNENQIEPLRQRYLEHYRNIVAVSSRLFDGFEEVLQTLENSHIIWGIVTNKPQWLTTPLLQQLSLDQRAAVVICGDTLEHRKPHPLPLIVAAEKISSDCSDCLYIGDDRRDIDAGNAAGMATLIANYGYIPENTNIAEWQADGIIEQPKDLLTHTLLTYPEDSRSLRTTY